MSIRHQQNGLSISRLLFVAFFVWYACYSFIGAIELPIGSTFDMFHILDKMYKGNLSFSDFLVRYCEHGMLGSYLLLIFQTKVFGFTTIFDIGLNVINVSLVAFLCLKEYRCTNEIKDTVCYVFGFAILSFFAFNPMQGSASGMDTQVRMGLLFCVISGYMLSRVLTKEKKTIYIIVCCLMFFFSINIFGTLYSFAEIPAVLILISISFLQNKKMSLKPCAVLVTVILCSALYFFEYGVLSPTESEILAAGGGEKGFLSKIIEIVVHPDYWFGCLLEYCGSFVLGYGIWADGVITPIIYRLVGLIVLIVTIYSVFRFFLLRIHQKTWFPLFLIIYSFSIWFIVMVGRGYQFGEGWLTSTWYHVHTKTAMIAICWILFYDLQPFRKRCVSFISIAMIISLAILGIAGECYLYKREPYVKVWVAGHQKYLFAEKIEEFPVDDSGLTPLQQSPETTLACINFMKEHHLSIYRYYGAYEEMKMQRENVNNVEANQERQFATDPNK